MLNVISKIKLLRGGKSGFELTGSDVLSTQQSRISDGIVRTRNLPVPLWSRELFHRLKYPVLVYTRHWLPVWDTLMERDYSSPDTLTFGQTDEWIASRLQEMWRDTEVHSIEDTSGGFRIECTIVMGGKNNSVKALISPESDGNIYLRTRELFERICEEYARLMTQNILPSSTEEIKAIAEEIDHNLTSLSDSEILEKILDLADKRGVQIGFTLEQLDAMLPETTTEDDAPVIISSTTENHQDFEDAPLAPED